MSENISNFISGTSNMGNRPHNMAAEERHGISDDIFKSSWCSIRIWKPQDNIGRIRFKYEIRITSPLRNCCNILPNGQHISVDGEVNIDLFCKVEKKSVKMISKNAIDATGCRYRWERIIDIYLNSVRRWSASITPTGERHMSNTEWTLPPQTLLDHHTKWYLKDQTKQNYQKWIVEKQPGSSWSRLSKKGQNMPNATTSHSGLGDRSWATQIEHVKKAHWINKRHLPKTSMI